MTILAGAEGRGDRPVRRRSRFTLARARAEPLALQGHRRIRWSEDCDTTFGALADLPTLAHSDFMTDVAQPEPAPNPDPFFETIPDGLWNACIGVQGSEEAYIDGYIEAARELVVAVIDKKMFGSRDSLAMPILYNCRHAIELSLKFAINRLHDAGMVAERHKPDHDIRSQWTHLRDAKVGDARIVDLVAQLEPYVASLAAVDDDGQELRYASNCAGVKSLGGFAVVNLPHIRTSIEALEAILGQMKIRVLELEQERLTGAHTGECSREDLKRVAAMVGPHSGWGDAEFSDRKAKVMESFGLGSRKFSQALTTIRNSRPLATLVGIETSLKHLSDDKAVAALSAWAEAHPVKDRTADLGSSFFPRDPEAIATHQQRRQSLNAAMTALLTSEELADLETVYYLGRNREDGEHYDANLEQTQRTYGVSGRPMGRLDDVFSKTNLLDAFVDGAAAAGRPSLAQKVRAIRPGR